MRSCYINVSQNILREVVRALRLYSRSSTFRFYCGILKRCGQKAQYLDAEKNDEACKCDPTQAEADLDKAWRIA